MECIYFPELNEETKEFVVTNDEQKHLLALRLQIGDYVLVSNGKAICAESIITNIGKHNFTLRAEKILLNHGELPFQLGLAIGMLSDRNRLEFALEKAIELGASDFFPIITEHTEKKFLHTTRLVNKAVSAMKQCKRAKLINIHEPIVFDNIQHIISKFNNIILTDTDGKPPEETKSLDSTVIFIGPEGGFSEQEIQNLKSIEGLISWNLGARRLRAETAAICALNHASLKMGSGC